MAEGCFRGVRGGARVPWLLAAYVGGRAKGGTDSGSLGCVDEGRRSSSSVVEWVRKRRGEAEGVSDTAGGAGEMIAG